MPNETGAEIAETSAVKMGPEVSRELFGGVLEFDAAGHYPGLELFNLIYCGASEDVLPEGGEIEVVRRSNDFGRRLVWDSSFADDPRRHDVLLDDDDAEETLRGLLRCLQLEIPSGTKNPQWHRAHFFPYTPSLIHWDARNARGLDGHAVGIERKYLRGGGALAYKILRTDPDIARLDRVRKGFAELYRATVGGPLETLARFINAQSTSDAKPVTDYIEKISRSNIDGFEDSYRDGVLTILEQVAVTSVEKVRAVMGWTALWLVLMQDRRARQRLGLSSSPLICDCGAGSSQLRRASQRYLKDALANIHAAVVKVEPRVVKRQATKIQGFYWATAAAAGFLNAWRGRKHYTFSVDLLEMIVLSSIPAGTQITFERFVTEVLYQKLGIAVGRGAAEESGLVNSIDASIFEENEAQLAVQMMAAGLVTQYSDATRMVGYKAAS